ncbi:MAG: DUF418 domain-containing protein [Blastocatellia bacterium]|nr:DUF418 domain-containing protein [Blastocatellia bacterium]
MTPTSGHERYEFLDVLRGFALFGIITANMILYSLYLSLPESARVSMSTYPTDRVLDFLELVLIEGKFYTIFSVLFGIGFSILLTRAQAKSSVFHRFFLKRMFFLYLIGVAHAVLFWHDDILQFYAFCGALLLPFVRVRNRTLIAFSVLALAAGAAIKLTGAIPPESLTGPRDLLFARFGFTHDSRIAIWTHGSLPNILRLNLSSWFGQVEYVISSGMLFKIFGCFLLGFYIGRNEIYKSLEKYRLTIKRVAIVGLATGIPLNLIYAYTFSSESWLRNLSEALAILPLSAGYASLLCLLWLSPRGDTLLKYFAPVGRMALTNYVGQSVICTLIFYGTGLGLGGTMGPTLYLPIGFAVYLAQIAVSRLWLDRFQFGPLEWIWRMLTYGSWIPLTKRAIV